MFPSKNTKEFQPWHAMLLIGVVLTALVLGILQQVSSNDGDMPEPPAQQAILNEQTCSVSGGTWNSCGSACRMDPDAVCIEVCVEYCECVADDQCPFGYRCGDHVDGVGVCL